MKNLTVSDILNRKHFENIQVLAGHEGLQRTVKWVHIVEVTNIRKLLNGKELILSTGVGWKENDSLFQSFIKQLIECDASGLCIEVRTYNLSIPETVLQLANQHQFPIIIFLNEVPFVEITQDIHSYIINQQYELISKLENYSQTLNKKVLTMKHYSEILHFLHQYTNFHVIFQLNGKDPEYIPSSTKHLSPLSNQTATQTIFLLGNQFGQLTIVSKYRELSEFDLLLLDRTTTALSHHILRDLYVEEKRRAEENEWLKEWMKGEHSYEVISEFLSNIKLDRDVKGGVICVTRLQNLSQSHQFDRTYLKLFIKSIFEQNGFQPFFVDFGQSMIFILLNKRSVDTWKERVRLAMTRMNESEFFNRQNIMMISISFGKFVHNLTAIHESYETAIETLNIQRRLPNASSLCFYDDLHMYRVISNTLKTTDLKEVVYEYLAPIIEYDEKYNTKLMETLKVYLSCNGSKKETAKKLFIVRQTLYHRIQKLESLLGKDFMSAEKRLTTEFMIKVYEFINPPFEEKPVAHVEKHP